MTLISHTSDNYLNIFILKVSVISYILLTTYCVTLLYFRKKSYFFIFFNNYNYNYNYYFTILFQYWISIRFCQIMNFFCDVHSDSHFFIILEKKLSSRDIYNHAFWFVVMVFCVVLLCALTFWVPCCYVLYDFSIKTLLGSSLPPVVCRRAHVLFTLFLFVCA
jgi:hypothetical protein